MSRSRSLPALILLAIAPVLGGRASADPRPKATANRLAGETSPYLRLHAGNPVDWYPWGPEAFAKAKAEGKPIFLSVGYSSCHWCHVMERECFVNAAIAEYLNGHFVSIKVDREERPDVDQIYMTALQALGTGSGWPMSMFLTPDGRPFFGGTYFPPEDRDGFEGFPGILRRVDGAWREHRAELEKDSDRLVAVVRRVLSDAPDRGRVPLSRDWVARGRAELAGQFDPVHGGFGYDPESPRRPKFPEPVNLVFLLDQHRRGLKGTLGTGPEPLAMVASTLDHMARGGIRDHLAGGYHRYATVRDWSVPHFEKMLYDNAQLASACLLAFEATGDGRRRREAEAVFAFVARTMTSPEGAFYSALDAESEGEEGRCYVWTRDEVARVLGGGDDASAFARVYGLTTPPNFPGDRHVLLEPRPRGEQAAALGTTPEALEARLAPLRDRLLAARDRRPQPPRDDKVLTSWNGLMIAAYADGYRLLEDPACRRAAERAADFLLTHLRSPDGRLLRTYREGRAKLPAYLEDYAFLAHGLLRLHAATGDASRLAQARELTDRMVADFEDERQGGFFSTADGHEGLLARPKDPHDGVLPGGNSVAIRNLVALAAATGEPRYLDAAGRALDAFSPRLSRSPAALPLMLVALDEYLDARSAAGRPQAADAGAARDGGDPAAAKVPAVVEAKAAPAPGAVVGPGRTFEVVVTVAVKEGWHIYANPAGEASLRPTAIALPDGQPATLAEVRYPPGEPLAGFPGAGDAEPASVYRGEVTLRARVRLDDKAGPGPLTLDLRLSYQACNDRACLAPASRRVPLSLTATASP
jgi:uncharacterized protein